MPAPKKKVMPATKSSSKPTGPAKAIPVNRKELDAQQKKLQKMYNDAYQSGLKAGLKSSKIPGSSTNALGYETDRAAGFSAGAVSGKQDIAKFKRNQTKKK